jgi:transposase InsO family protein
MPWTETCVMEERVKLIMDVLDDTYCMTELCNYYGISRKTGYKWLARYNQGGIEALRDLSRAPLSHPQEISHRIKETILAVKSRFPRWGAPKIRARLEREYPNWHSYPAISTIGLFLRNQNLTCPRKKRHKATPTKPPLTNGRYINQVWCADFKGHFSTGNGSRCNPLTISDHASRYLLCCRHVDQMSYELVKMCFERIFREYGLPEVIRTDNGTPFSSRGLGGLSRLSYWWIRLGVYPERIEPGHPEQNGRHERIHKTLKDYTARPAAMTLSAQQQRFNKFRREYNEHRPHEALQMRTPSDCYSSSLREFPSRLPKISYPDHMQIKRVQSHGGFRYKGRRLFTTECLASNYVGIEQIDEDTSLLWYCDYLLARIDHRRWQVVPLKPSHLSVQLAGQINEGKPTKVLPMSSA